MIARLAGLAAATFTIAVTTHAGLLWLLLWSGSIAAVQVKTTSKAQATEKRVNNLVANLSTVTGNFSGQIGTINGQVSTINGQLGSLDISALSNFTDSGNTSYLSGLSQLGPLGADLPGSASLGTVIARCNGITGTSVGLEGHGFST